MKNNIKTYTRKISKNKKGNLILEATIGIFALVILICFLCDVIIIARKQYVISQQANLISRELAVQGGVMTQAPVGFPGTSSTNGLSPEDSYVVSSEMYNAIKTNFGNIGLSTSKGDWSVTILSYNKSGNVVSKETLSPNTNISADYGLPMDVTINYKYRWSLFGQITGLVKDISESTSRHSVSEFKYNYDNWDGEN